jgi:hypothetical protein
MRPITPAVAVLEAIVIVVALLFVAATFTKPWVYARWVKLAFWIFAFATLIVTGLTLLMAFHAFPWAAFWALYSLKMVFMGLASGMLLLFFLSGEAVRGLRRWRELRRESRARLVETSKA